MARSDARLRMAIVTRDKAQLTERVGRVPQGKRELELVLAGVGVVLGR